MKEKTPGFCFSGFLIMMLMPRFMNGLLKSITVEYTNRKSFISLPVC